MPDPASRLALVYACSGCSSAAQLANHLAVRLDRNGEAEMSCIAGVGGGVKPLVRIAQRAQRDGRPILAIDGCALGCVKHALEQVGAQPTRYLQLADSGVRKLAHADFDPVQAAALLRHCTEQARELAAAFNPPRSPDQA
ncbi:DGC domain protein [mine drainage metagenome]|uniref:DGC domain protein n=1 Tax=mine drainage metagenome TaxID=410659 RepID=A0A1J5Q6H2_9ZZZZ